MTVSPLSASRIGNFAYLPHPLAREALPSIGNRQSVAVGELFKLKKGDYLPWERGQIHSREFAGQRAFRALANSSVSHSACV